LLFDEIAMIKSGTQKQIIERLLRDRTLWKEIDLYSKKPEDNFARISEALRGNISNKLRAQSRGLHRLGMGVPESKVAFIKSLRLENLNIHPKVLALLQFSIGVSISYEDSSGANSFLGAAINAFLTYVAARFFKEMLRNDTEISRQTNCSALLLMVITIVTFFIFSEHLLQVEGFESPSSLMIAATIIWVTLLILLVSGVSESLKIMNSIAKMEAEINIDLLDKVRILSEHEAQARHDLGKFIHGFLINKVQATATHLDALAVQGKFDDYEENLLKLFDEFSVDSINTKLNSRILDLDFIEKLKALWAEMIVIEVEADEAIFTKFQKPQALELGRVIEEMVSNAFRHGNATQINILFSAKDEIQLQIMARDNGLGIAGKPRPGLGSQIFEMSSGGNWTLGNFDTGGAQVVVNVELYSPESKLVW
jgi:signal transduction histidine kinase